MVIVATVVAFTVVPAMKPMIAMAESNEFTDPYIAMLGDETTSHLDAYDVHWYKLDIPDDIAAGMADISRIKLSELLKIVKFKY